MNTETIKKHEFDAAAWLRDVNARGYTVYLTAEATGIGWANVAPGDDRDTVLQAWRDNGESIRYELLATQKPAWRDFDRD